MAGDELWRAARLAGVWEQGPSEARMWQPSPALEACIADVEGSREAGTPLLAVDLGCSKGRDVIFLANRGWRVIGVDNAQGFLSKLDAFAERAGVAPLVTTRCLDIGPKSELHVLDWLRSPSSWTSVAATTPTSAVVLVNICRFMPPPRLLSRVRDLLPTGACVCICHFAAGAVSAGSGKLIGGGSAPQQKQSPKKNVQGQRSVPQLAKRSKTGAHVVSLDELRSVFKGWQVLLARSTQVATYDSRPIVHFAARKIAR